MRLPLLPCALLAVVLSSQSLCAQQPPPSDVQAMPESCTAVAPGAPARNYPTPVEGDWTARDFQFASGERLAEVRMHYCTLGTAQRNEAGMAKNAVLILHGTGGAGRQFL